MKQKCEKCNKCNYSAIEKMQHDLMLGMDTSSILCPDSEEEYEDLKYALESYMIQSDLKDNINASYFNCINCNSKLRVEKSKKYFNKMIEIINCDQYDYDDKVREYDDKLRKIYSLQNEYFTECGGF